MYAVLVKALSAPVRASSENCLGMWPDYDSALTSVKSTHYQHVEVN